MHVALISPFDFLPNEPVRPGRYGHLSRELASRGHRVTWLSSSFSHQHKRQRFQEEWKSPPGIALVPVRAAGYPSNTHPRRLLSQGQFAWNARAALGDLFRLDVPPDVVVAASPPLLAPWFAGRVAKAAKIPFVVDIIDLWPDAFERFLPQGFATTAGLFPFRRLRDAVHRAPDVLVAVARDYLEHAPHPRTEVFHLGHDMDAFDAAYSPTWQRLTKGPDERWIVYVGTVSHNYDLRLVLAVAPRFPGERFWVIGDGEALSELKTRASETKLDNVVFTGRLPYSDLANLIARADVGLLGVNARAQIWFPYKAFDYLAAGLKVVTSIGPGELHDLVAQERLGEFYREGDPLSLERALVACLHSASSDEKSRIRAFGRRRFSSSVIYRRYADLLESLAAASK